MTTTAHHLFEDPRWSDAEQQAHLDALLCEPRSLLDADPEMLTAHGRVEMLVQIHQEQARLAALEMRAFAAAAGPHRRARRVDVVDEARERHLEIELADEVREELAAALRLSPGQAYDRIALARILGSALPLTQTALSAGEISAQHARVIAEQARRLAGYQVVVGQEPALDAPDEAQLRARFMAACGELESRVLGIARRSTPGRTRTAARRAVAAIDAAGEERRRREARQAIDVHLLPADDGLALLEAWLPAEQAARVHAALDAQARSTADDSGRTVGQRRADALVAAVCGSPGSGSNVRTEIQITIDLASLAGIVDGPALVSSGAGSTHVTTAGAVRDLLADPRTPVSIRRLITDPVTGHLLDRGRRSYAVTRPLRAFLVARDGCCRFPGCTRAASRSQVDHAVEWSKGGRTDRVNLGHLCVRHHQLKTHGGWTIEYSEADGSCRWRSPSGRTYDVDPPPF